MRNQLEWWIALARDAANGADPSLTKGDWLHLLAVLTDRMVYRQTYRQDFGSGHAQPFNVAGAFGTTETATKAAPINAEALNARVQQGRERDALREIEQLARNALYPEKATATEAE